ncbi:leucyl/phenylalanyl-tRNA--protein transferase [Neoasaia chiangmaiensis NBRC 101099]|uniref:Leucyl/phenylalanyl-tRNA--protein transferase n=1 Tax=Neoasaia chiangmaiensis TaxID=320497 RepID=A0A1U9KNQ3_9PROT|nr:leucyl/phenylalanyl-tRNA--protein transferase [Neoasaia chiangmaiensis]AQS87418.1 leucyl/phenylalanyl-tRNA--protein transferase [Neoasaia chiangmaiensis]GBR42794.1 leucyl/phenylalanyl-tRNA--protein transferase [Neoasaia chiangmaiensis NBRC 101099]GEN16190.1 leucyl/phenylalanyl-tRNA--protein transferase [Neoasaia chiangmaiensis]
MTPDMLLNAYAMGIFPMAPDQSSDQLEWFMPERRGILPLDTFHVPRKLGRLVLSGRYRVTSDTAFPLVMRECAAAAAGRETTWISDRILALYGALHARGDAHSVEVWDDERLVGGLYGVSLGGAFFGESMFSRVTDTSKIALVHLAASLRRQSYILLDTQYPTPHLARFGGTDISADHYRTLLNRAMPLSVVWSREIGLAALGDEIRSMRERHDGSMH